MKKPTIRDIAKYAGVSDTTVSLAFREGSRISDKTRAKVLKAASRLSYVPNQAAKALREGDTRTLGLLVNDLTNPFYARVVREVETIASECGYQVLVAENQYEASRELANLQRMLHARVQGLLVCFSEMTDEMTKRVAAQDLPTVALDSVPASYQGAAVLHDLEASGRLAAEHLLAVGCQCPAFAGPVERPLSAVTALRKGFESAVMEAGLSPCPMIPGGFDFASGHEAFVALLSADQHIDGLFCANDLCALGVMEAADAARVAIGPDLALMGIGDMPVSSLRRIDLTSIREPDDKLAEIAAKALIEAVTSGHKPTIRQHLQPELISRSTTQRTAPSKDT